MQNSSLYRLKPNPRRTTRRQAACPESFADDLDQHPLGPPAVEFAVKNLLPRAEVELAARDRDDNFAAHDLALVMSVGVIFAGAVVLIPLRRWVERRQRLQPFLVIRMQPW